MGQLLVNVIRSTHCFPDQFCPRRCGHLIGEHYTSDNHNFLKSSQYSLISYVTKHSEYSIRQYENILHDYLKENNFQYTLKYYN
jgi:hypothetical protein